MMEGITEREPPRYKCHKEVYALKIAKISPGEPDGVLITPAEDGYAPFFVNQEYVTKHNPQVGGYYVSYKDGYSSYSPAKAFEEGYSLIE